MTSVTIIRHKRERLSKCSLQGLSSRPGMNFYTNKRGFTFDATGFIVLSIHGPVLTALDQGAPLLLLDSTWRLLPDLEACLTGTPMHRQLPACISTAYPRVNKKGLDPAGGLASIEALYAAKYILGENDPSLLDHYYWKDAFLKQFESFQAR